MTKGQNQEAVAELYRFGDPFLDTDEMRRIIAFLARPISSRDTGMPMISIPTFDALLDAISQLPPEQQAELVDVVRMRLAALRRQQLIADVREAEADLASGKGSRTTARDLMGDLTRDLSS